MQFSNDHLQAMPTQTLFINCAFILFILGMAFIVFLFVSRLLKSFEQKRSDALRLQFRNIINEFIVTEGIAESHNPATAVEFKINTLKAMIRSGFSKQVLLDQIIEIKKNLSGNSVIPLMTIYSHLKLHEVSLKKLRSLRWYLKATGIRELSEMDYAEAVPLITKFLASRNNTLREEAILAHLRLDSEHRLTFLDSYEDDVTLWMRINLHHYLQKMDVRTLPQFSTWFNNTNASVVLFAINMMKAFRQLGSMNELAKLLDHENETVVAVAVETISILEGFEHADAVAALGTSHFADEVTAKRIVQCLGNVGDKKHHSLLLKFVLHPVYEVRFEALRSLKKLGFDTTNFGTNRGVDNDEVRRILNHLSEPLLQ